MTESGLGDMRSRLPSTTAVLLFLALLFVEAWVVSGTYDSLPPIQRFDRVRLNPVRDLLSLLNDTLGTDPADCGQFLLSEIDRAAASAEQLHAAVRCVVEHAALRQPAFVVVQLHGIDSWVANGLVAISGWTRLGKPAEEAEIRCMLDE